MDELKNRYGTLGGVVLAGAVAAVGYAIARIPAIASMGLSPLLVAILVGMIVGNAGASLLPAQVHRGIAFAQKRILRLAIVLYGFRVTFQEIAGVGAAGLLADVVMLSSTFLIGIWAGRRFFGLDRDTAILCAAGSSICGAAAVLATEPVVRAEPYKVTVAVGTVVVFGTIAMFVYPLLYRVAGMDPQTFGIYTGSTVHEVAHVVAVGGAVGGSAAATAVIVKLTRVMLLAPFLVILSAVVARREPEPALAVAEEKRELVAVGAGGPAGPERAAVAQLPGPAARRPKIAIPWFAVLFVAVSGFHSLAILPHAVVGVINSVDTFLLATAMAALGIDSRLERFRGVGAGPILAATTMFVWLVAGGYLVNRLVAALVG
ncbi:YeiH family protein [Salinispira pacifica]